MKLTRYQSDEERTILTGVIVHDRILARIVSKVKHTSSPFRSKWANLIFKWCVAYFSRYEKAPRASIQSLFRHYAEKIQDEDTIAIIEKFLVGLSDDYKGAAREMNPDYLVDLAAKYFNRVKCERETEEVQAELLKGDVESAVRRMTSFTQVDLATTSVVKVFNDKEAFKDVLYGSENEVLIQYPGDLGDFFGPHLQRDGFIAYLAPEKRGKCVSGDTQVLMADGSVQTIEMLVKKRRKRRIVSYNEKSQRFEIRSISQFWENGEKECVRVVTRTGRMITTTENHQYLTPTGWKFLKDIKEGEFIAVPKSLPFFGKTRMRSEEVRFFAYVLAEGCLVKCFRKGIFEGYECSFTNTDLATIEDFHRCCDVLGFRYRRKGITTYLYKEAKEYLAQFGMMGYRSKEKYLPSHILRLPKDQVAEFLRVFFTCDGSIYRDGWDLKIECSLASEKLLYGISHLLNRFGVVHRVIPFLSFFKGKTFPAWQVVVGSSEHVARFLEEINFDSYKKRPLLQKIFGRSFLDRVPYERVKGLWDSIKSRGKGELGRIFQKKKDQIREQIRLKRPMMRGSFSGIEDPEVLSILDSSILWDQVTAIEHVGKKMTFDIGIDDLHNFVANDIIVHNSFVLLDTAWRAAVDNRRRTLLYSVGDMSQRQMMRRLTVRAARRPIEGGTVVLPKRIRVVDGVVQLKTREEEYAERITLKEVGAAIKQIKVKTAHSSSLLRMRCTAVSTTRVMDIRTDIDEMVREGWVPEVLVLDYADILAPERVLGEGDVRHQTDETWKALRKLSQDYHMLVVTATQSNAASYDAKVIRRSHFSEDKRKMAHVTGMVGINQAEDEKRRGVFRLNWVLLREGFYTESRCVSAAGCLAIANPFMVSSW